MNAFNTDIGTEPITVAQPSADNWQQRFASDTQPFRAVPPAAQTATTPAAAVIDTAAQTLRQSVSVLALAWSAEEPDAIAEPLDAAWDHDAVEPTRAQRWYRRPGLLAGAAAAAFAVTAAGLFVSLHSGGPPISSPVATSKTTAPAVPAPVGASPTTPAVASPPPTATQTVTVDQASMVPQKPPVPTPRVQHTTQFVAPLAPPAPTPAAPTWTPKPTEYWPPIWASHPPTSKGGENWHHGR